MPNPLRIDPATLPILREALAGEDRRPSAPPRPSADQLALPLVLGVITGYRSVSPLALLSAAAQRPEGAIAETLGNLGPLGALRSRPALIITGLAALGEMIGDKLPIVPSRVSAGPLGGRIAIGAATGALTARAKGGSAPLGAALGGVAAAASAASAFSIRRAITHRTPTPDIAIGLLEDMLVLALGALVLRRLAPTGKGKPAKGAFARRHP